MKDEESAKRANQAPISSSHVEICRIVDGAIVKLSADNYDNNV